MTHDARVGRPVQPLRVLESFRAPRATTNPYLVLLLRSLPDDIRVRTFSWSAAFWSRYDVLHVHWPEVVVERRNSLRALLATALFALVLVRCRLLGTAVVRTAHNVQPHERKGATTRLVLRFCDRSTRWWIRLNDWTPTPPDAPVTTIPLGHYRDWFADVDGRSAPSVPGRLLYFGLIRPYKGVEALLAAFRRTEADLSLRVVGRPNTPELAARIEAAARGDARIQLFLDHVPDDVLAAEVLESELVVLPYRDMHNSSAALLALSLDRPVLVTDNDVTRALAAELGESFVLRFHGELDATALVEALDEVRRTDRAGPDLRRRDWGPIGEQHAQVFRAAAGRRGRP